MEASVKNVILTTRLQNKIADNYRSASASSVAASFSPGDPCRILVCSEMRNENKAASLAEKKADSANRTAIAINQGARVSNSLLLLSS